MSVSERNSSSEHDDTFCIIYTVYNDHISDVDDEDDEGDDEDNDDGNKSEDDGDESNGDDGDEADDEDVSPRCSDSPGHLEEKVSQLENMLQRLQDDLQKVIISGPQSSSDGGGTLIDRGWGCGLI